MPRLFGVDIPGNKKVPYALAYIKGIGISTGKDITQQLGIDENLRADALTEEDLNKIASLIDQEFVVEGELGRQTRDNVKRLIDIGTYRGDRHRKNLPVHGQRTRGNARTRKGKRKAVAGVSVRKVLAKT